MQNALTFAFITGLLVSTSVFSQVQCKLKTQGGTCDRIVTPAVTAGPNITQTLISGTAHLPGHRICLAAGTYPYASVVFQNFTGALDSPIQFINCDGQFVLGNNIDNNHDGYVDSSRGITFNNSKFVKITGSGSPAHKYGIKLSGSSQGNHNLVFNALSTNMEGEFLEVSHAGFAGIMAKTDPICSDTNPNSFRGGFIQKNTVFHDNFIHDVKGEGFYLGYSFFYGYSNLSGCVNTKVYSHPLEGVKVYNNRLENIGCEAIQIGIGKDSEVYNNYIKGYGLDPFASFQNNGIQVGSGTSGKFYNNYIENPNPSYIVGNGIIVVGYRDTWVFGNVIVNPSTGIYVHKDFSKSITGIYEPHKLKIANNTIYYPTGVPNAAFFPDPKGLWLNNGIAQIELKNNISFLADPITAITVPDHILRNSIFDNATTELNQQAGITGNNITQSDNLKAHYGDHDLYLIDVNERNFLNVPGSNIINSGADVGNYGFTTSMRIDHVQNKILLVPRIDGAAIDKGAMEYFAPQITAQSSVSVAEGQSTTIAVSTVNAVALAGSGLPGFVVLNQISPGNYELVISPGYTVAGEHILTLNATNAEGGVVSKAIALTIQNTNRAPVILPIGQLTAKEAELKNFSVFASDPDGDVLTWSVQSGLPAFVTLTNLSNGQGNLEVNASYADAGIYSINLLVQDAQGAQDLVAVSLLVQDSPYKIAHMLLINADTDVVIGEIVNGMVLDLDLVGTQNLSIEAQSEPGVVGSVQFKLNGMIIRTENGRPYALNGDGKNPDNSTDYFPLYFAEGTYALEITPYTGASGTGTAGETKSALFTLTKNHPPVLSGVANQSVNENNSQTVAISATDPDGDVVTLSVQNLPSFATFSNGTLTLAPQYNHAGSYDLIFVATDAKGLQDQKTLSLTVNNVNRAPTITTGLLSVAVTESQTLDLIFNLNDPDQQALTVQELSLPAFASLVNSTQAQRTYRLAPTETTVTQDQLFNLVLQVNDGEATAQVNVEILVRNNIPLFATIKINTTTASGPYADATWNHTNVLATTGAQTATFKDSVGVQTPYKIIVTQRFTSSRGSAGGSDGGKLTGNNSGIVPDAVLGGVFYVDQTSSAILKFADLDVRKKYVFKFVSSRAAASGTKATIFSAQGQSVQVEALNNTSQWAILNNLLPSASGEIDLTIKNGPGSPFGYLNGIVIEESIQ